MFKKPTSTSPMARCLGRAPESDEDAHHQARAALCPYLKDTVWQKEVGASLPASKPVF